MRRGLALAALLVATVLAACGASKDAAEQTPPPAATPVAETPSVRPAGRIAFRPHLTFADKRGSYAGVAFVVDSTRPLAIIPSHVVLSLLKGSTLQRFELTDAETKESIVTAKALAIPAGPPMDGFDFSTDFAFVTLDAIPEGVARIALAPERPRVGDAVEVIACPADGSTPEVTIQGKVSYASSTRLELSLEAPGVTRGFSGAPILLKSTGHAIGIVQAVVVTGGTNTALARATPAEAIAPKLERAEAASSVRPFASWSKTE